MKNHECTEEIFRRDTKDHQMTVLRDDGIYRHIRFGKPGTGFMHFELVTWPGHLAYSGDMGCYVFTRLRDMFEFFRTERDEFRINPQYWGEKCCASQSDGVTEYSAAVFREAIQYWLDEADASEEIRQAVADEVLIHADDGEYAAMRAALDFEHDGFDFQDFWETNLRAYTFRFVWCCYALAWAIREYDRSKVTQPLREPTPAN
jgi:hypothetical protein